MDSMKKILKRCHKCMSSNIHKRVRIQLGSDNKKGRLVKLPMSKRERKTKYYRCYDCKYEFDNPLISEPLAKKFWHDFVTHVRSYI